MLDDSDFGMLDRHLGRIAEAIEALSPENREPADPEEGWCEGTVKDGSRCTLDAVRDGLCKAHWRMAHRRPTGGRRKGTVTVPAGGDGTAAHLL